VKAARAGDEALVVELLARGADADDAEGDGCTALWHAAKRGHQGIVGLLLGGGADTERMGGRARTVNGFGGATPLGQAAYHGHAETCSQLLAAGAAVNAKTGFQEGVNLLHFAKSGSGCVEVLEAAGGVL
jgi:hypothetical protein